MRITPMLAIAAVSLLTAAPLAAAAVDAAKVIAARHAGYKDIARNMKAMSDNLKTGSPDPALIRASANAIAASAARIPGWFPMGSGPETGLKTHAKPEIWQHPDAFRAKAQDLRAQALKMAALAGSGDADALGAQLRAVGGTCKACHDDFRMKDAD